VLILHKHEHGALAAIGFSSTALSLPALASDDSLKELHRDELAIERLQLS
jgi:hypothetical protein